MSFYLWLAVVMVIGLIVSIIGAFVAEAFFAWLRRRRIDKEIQAAQASSNYVHQQRWR